RKYNKMCFVNVKPQYIVFKCRDWKITITFEATKANCLECTRYAFLKFP
ncbi:unnamed protein product, partial [marine sediment metagenome]